MHLDVLDLRKFYYRTPLGRIVKRALTNQMEHLLGDVKGKTVVGYGFAAPCLRPFEEKARRLICLMPGQQGVMPWPNSKDNVSVLCSEFHWPIETGRVDCLIVLHGLETCDNTGDLMDEIWRVLGPGGRVVFVVPNRSGLWARSEKTPFGFGRPYSIGQMETQLRAHNFQIERHRSALFFPPSQRPFWLKFANYREGWGLKGVIPLAAGVVLIEASKQVYAHNPPGGLPEAVKRPLGVLEGIAKAPGKPVQGFEGKRGYFDKRSKQ